MARHAAEGITKNLWFAILQLILYQFIMPDIVNTMSVLFLRLPFSRRYAILLDSFSNHILHSIYGSCLFVVFIFGDAYMRKLRILVLDAT